MNSSFILLYLTLSQFPVDALKLLSDGRSGLWFYRIYGIVVHLFFLIFGSQIIFHRSLQTAICFSFFIFHNNML